MTFKIMKSKIRGNLDIHFVTEFEELHNVEESTHEILIHGDSTGLKSFANLLLEIANADQEIIDELPNNARLHVTLNPSIDLSGNSNTTTIGRLDAKGTGKYYSKFISRNQGA